MIHARASKANRVWCYHALRLIHPWWRPCQDYYRVAEVFATRRFLKGNKLERPNWRRLARGFSVVAANPPAVKARFAPSFKAGNAI